MILRLLKIINNFDFFIIFFPKIRPIPQVVTAFSWTIFDEICEKLAKLVNLSALLFWKFLDGNSWNWDGFVILKRTRHSHSGWGSSANRSMIHWWYQLEKTWKDETWWNINLLGPHVVNVTSVPWISLWAPTIPSYTNEIQKTWKQKTERITSITWA